MRILPLLLVVSVLTACSSKSEQKNPDLFTANADLTTPTSGADLTAAPSDLTATPTDLIPNIEPDLTPVAAPAALTITSAPIDLGAIVIDTTKSTLVTVTNTGGSESGALAFAFEGADAAELALNSAGTCAVGATLDAGASCTVGLDWHPITAGTKSATLVVSATPGGPATAAIVGTALTPAALQFGQATYTPTPNNPVAKGNNTTITLTLFNSSTQASGVLPAIATMTNTAFTVVGGTCAAGGVVPANGSCTIVVQFAPTSFGTVSDTLTLTASPGGTASTTITATGQETLTLTATRAGNGTGEITIAGEACVGYPCTRTYTVTTGPAPSVTLTTTADVSSTFTSWAATPTAASCTGATCQLTMDRDRGAVATFTLKKVNVTIDLVGIRGATGAVSANVAPALVCNSTSCSGSYDYGTNVTFTAAATGGHLFQSWAASPCASRFATTCASGALTTDFTTSVTFRPRINYAFVTSESMDVTKIGPDLMGADRFCDTRAREAGLVNTPVAPAAPYFKALLATSTTSAHSRIDSARGWIRADGKEFASDPKDLFNEAGATKPYQIFYPLDVDENGNFQGNYVATGADRDGNTQPNGNCQDWTANGGCSFPAQLGAPDAGNGVWLTTQSNCGCTSWRVYCFETAQPPTAITATAPAQKRVAFISNGTLNGGATRAAADALCSTEATGASLAGTYMSLLPTTGTAAAARFSNTGANWVRPDGVPIASNAPSFLNAAWSAPFTQLANGSYAMAPYYPTWVGAQSPSAVPDADSDTCTSWSSTTGTGRYNIMHSALNYGYAWSNQVCTTASRVFCVQQ